MTTPLDRITVTNGPKRCELGEGVVYGNETTRVIVQGRAADALPDWDVIGAHIVASRDASTVDYPSDLSGIDYGAAIEFSGLVDDVDSQATMAGYKTTLHCSQGPVRIP